VLIKICRQTINKIQINIEVVEAEAEAEAEAEVAEAAVDTTIGDMIIGSL
jgi:hypothetical protein